MLRKLLFLISWGLIFTSFLWITSANSTQLTYDDFWYILEPYSIVIGCYQGWTTYQPKDWVCKWKNILLPPKSHLKYFKKYFKEWNDWKLICDNSCLEKIAHRFSLVNFESWFNPNAISATNDYGYIQVNGGKDFLWEHKIQVSLDWLDSRWEDHLNNLCIPTYKVNPKNTDQVFKCLLMRHNWQKSLNNGYSLRWLSWKYYYLNYFKNKVEQKKIWERTNREVIKQIETIDLKNKQEERKEQKQKERAENVYKMWQVQFYSRELKDENKRWNIEHLNSLILEYQGLDHVPFYKLYPNITQDYIDSYISLKQLDPVSKDPTKRFLWKDNYMSILRIVKQYELVNILNDVDNISIDGKIIKLK